MELYKWISLKKERISSKLTLSNNSLRVVTEKYFCLTLLYRYCWHSRIIWTTVNAQLQEGHWGGFSWQRRYWCVRWVWPMRRCDKGVQCIIRKLLDLSFLDQFIKPNEYDRPDKWHRPRHRRDVVRPVSKGISAVCCRHGRNETD